MNQQTPIQTASADPAHLAYRPEIDELHLNPAWLPDWFVVQ